MTEQTTNTVNRKTLKQRLGAPYILWLVCVPVTFLSVYTSAWFSSRFNPDIQGTFNWIIRSKADLLCWKLSEYKEKFGQYPPNLIYLYANVAPDQVVSEEHKTQVTKGVDQDTWVKCGRWRKKWMKLIYQTDGQTFSLSHYGMDGEKGGVGLDTDVTFTLENMRSDGLAHNGLLTAPTFKQFLFEMDTSGAIFRISLYINLLLLLAFALQFGRSSATVNTQDALIYILGLIPICSIIAVAMTAFYYASSNSGH
jgi:hypothetical protein